MVAPSKSAILLDQPHFGHQRQSNSAQPRRAQALDLASAAAASCSSAATSTRWQRGANGAR